MWGTNENLLKFRKLKLRMFKIRKVYLKDKKGLLERSTLLGIFIYLRKTNHVQQG